MAAFLPYKCLAGAELIWSQWELLSSFTKGTKPGARFRDAQGLQSQPCPQITRMADVCSTSMFTDGCALPAAEAAQDWLGWVGVRGQRFSYQALKNISKSLGGDTCKLCYFREFTLLLSQEFLCAQLSQGRAGFRPETSPAIRLTVFIWTLI